LELKVPVLDVQLTGSLANYNYTEYSDLDTHIIIDFKQINDDEELVKKALDGARFVWNQRHDIVIKGHDVELYIQDESEQHTASGLYSLL
jgi:predicted nucleotidyltransferase